jgi:ABC-2 type transport system ATP-binding protein
MKQDVVLKLDNVTKKYGQKAAVQSVSMTIKKGDIYGLIGRNGAGKTTLTRIIAALTFANEGRVELFGESTPAGLSRARGRMGCVIETPSLYPHLTAYQNLEYYQRIKGIPNKEIINKTLETVGLTDTGKKKFRDFSMGMKQRLGIALTLLNSPDFIILDEPINGLDPAGIIEMREILRQLNEEHRITILISSHLLSELSLVASRYGIIEEGRLIKEFTNNELAQECQQALSIQVDDVKKATYILETVLKTKNFKTVSDDEIRLYDYLDNPAEVNYQLVANEVRVLNIKEVGDSLEDYFMSLIGHDK